MKRLILRMVALGIVVVLGLIAIAQAQRGAKDSSSASSQPKSVGGNASRPAPDSKADNSNPLRSIGHETVPASQFPVRQAAAQLPFGGQPGAVPSSERQDLPAAEGQSAPGLGGPRILQAANGVQPMPAAETVPARELPGGNRYQQLSGQLAAAEPGGAAVVASDSQQAPISQRYSPPLHESVPSREPAPFQADPQASPSGFPSAGLSGGLLPPQGATAGGFATAKTGAVLPGSIPSGEGSGKPGNKRLEGPQSPQLTIQKFAPEEIQVGKEATFRVTVRNTGTVPAVGVEVRDEIPKGTRLIGTTPRATQGPRGELVWTLGAIGAGEESTVEIQLMPVAEGEIGSVATVHFGADASVRTKATRPELVLKTSAPGEVLIGEEIVLSITVTNPGSGVATGVVLQERIPSGLEHSGGSELEYEIGDLPPGESRQLELTLRAKHAGRLTNVLTARGDGNLHSEARLELEVLAPSLAVSVAGPKRRYLERQATYQLSVHNPGTAPAMQVELVAYLPTGLEFVSANNTGQYEAADRTVHWLLEELPSGEMGTVELTAMPVDSGQQEIRLRGTAEKGLLAEASQPVLIEGIAAIMFEAVDVTDPIEVGGETTYEIRVVNQGSKAAGNVRLEVLLPPELQAVDAEGPTRHLSDGSQVRFEPLARLAPKADATYRVRAKGLQPGDLRVRVQLFTDEMSTPVTKEESTRVYADQ